VNLPRPYFESDDEALADGCVRSDDDAFRALFERHGALVEVAMLRELDKPAEGEDLDPPTLLAAVEQHLRRHDASAVRAWSARDCTMRAYLCVVARQVARRHAEATPTRTSLVAFFPTPAALHVQDVEVAESAIEVHELLERLPPTLGALARLRLRGMDRAAIAGAVGLGRAAVIQNLEKIATRLGSLPGGPGVHGPALATEAYRIVLGAADPAERARAAMRTEDEESFRDARSIAEATWREVRSRVLGKLPARTPICLDDRGVAGFVDGTMRGQARARSEGHVGACARCVDEVATLSTDLRAVPVLRDAQGLDHAVAVSAACLATTRFDAARRIAERARLLLEDAQGEEKSARAARDVERLASAASLLEGGRGRLHRESSGMVLRGLPSDEEAALVAFEALVASDAHAAFRAIDEHMAREPVAARLRLLAAASGEDAAHARKVATELLERPRTDPGAVEDAESVLALPDGRALPREILVERLRDVLPEVVRTAIARAARG
jgi:DNA-directed RNA polymerase specialized sigma24 family protein